MQQIWKPVALVLLLAQVALSYPSPNMDQIGAYKSWAEFDTTLSENLYPLATFMCATMDYTDLILPGLIQMPVTFKSFRDSVCKDIPEESLIDFSGLKQCYASAECLKTRQTLFGLGINEDQDVYKFFNITDIPKRTKVQTCLANPDCDYEEEARAQVLDWYDIIERCDEIEDSREDEIMDAILGAGMMNAQDSMGAQLEQYNMAVVKCMRRTSNPQVRRAIASSLQSGAICTQDMMMELGEYMSQLNEEEPDSDLITMLVGQKFLSCQSVNSTISNYIEPMLRTSNGRRSQLLWQIMSMMQEQSDSLKRRARGANGPDFSELLNGDLQQVYGEGENTVKRYTFSEYDELTDSELKYSVILASGPEFRSPYTVQMNYFKTANPPEEHQMTFTIDAPVWLEPIRKLVLGEQWTDLITWFIEQFIEGEPKIPSFAFTGSMYVDQLDVTSPILRAFQQDVMLAMQNAMEKIDFAAPFKLYIENIADSDRSIKFDASLSGEGYTVKLTINGPDSTVAEFNGKIIPIKEDGFFQTMGYRFEGSADMLDDKYTAVAQIFPFWFSDVTGVNRKRCEFVFKVRDETNSREIVNIESCHRPLELAENQIAALSLYRVFTIANIVRLNYTFDLGENGMPQFITSPKSLEINLDVYDTPIVNLTFVTRARSNMDYQGKEVPIIVIQTNATVTSPILGVKSQFGMTSSIFNDQSSSSQYTVNYFDYGSDQLISKSFGGVEVESCSAETENFFFNLMMRGQVDQPDVLCYTVEISNPETGCKFASKVKLDQRDGSYEHTYTLKTQLQGMPLAVEGKCMKNDNKRTSKHEFTLPMPATIQYTSQTFERGIEDEMQQGAINLFVNPQGFVFVAPQFGYTVTALTGYEARPQIHTQFDRNSPDYPFNTYVDINYPVSANISKSIEFAGNSVCERYATFLMTDRGFDVTVAFPKEYLGTCDMKFKLQLDVGGQLQVSLNDASSNVASLRADWRQDKYELTCDAMGDADGACEAIRYGKCPPRKSNCSPDKMLPPIFDKNCLMTCGMAVAPHGDQLLRSLHPMSYVAE